MTSVALSALYLTRGAEAYVRLGTWARRPRALTYESVTGASRIRGSIAGPNLLMSHKRSVVPRCIKVKF